MQKETRISFCECLSMSMQRLSCVAPYESSLRPRTACRDCDDECQPKTQSIMNTRPVSRSQEIFCRNLQEICPVNHKATMPQGIARHITSPGDSYVCWCCNRRHDPVLSLLLKHDLWQVPKHHPHHKIAPAFPCRYRLDAQRSGEACSSHCPGSGMEPPYTF